MKNAMPSPAEHTAARERGWQRWIRALSGLTSTQAPVTRSAAIILVGLTLVLLVINVAIVRQNSRLTAAVERASRSYVPAVGAIVPPLLGLDLDGRPRIVEHGIDGRDTLVFVFSPDCPASANAWPRWLALAQSASSQRARLIYANIGSPVPAAHPARSPTLDVADVIHVDARSLVSYNLQVSPQILRIAPDGRITDVWVGTLDGDEEAALQDALGIQHRVVQSSSLRLPRGAAPTPWAREEVLQGDDRCSMESLVS